MTHAFIRRQNVMARARKIADAALPRIAARRAYADMNNPYVREAHRRETLAIVRRVLEQQT